MSNKPEERMVRAITGMQAFIHNHILHLALIGGFVYLPLLNKDWFGWITWFLGTLASVFAPGANVMAVGFQVARIIHRICGFGIIVLAIVYAIWQVKDIKKWKIIRKGGSIEGLIKYYIAGEHANFDKYNPGQVLFFWVFIVPVVVVASITGLILVFKGAFDAYTVSLALLLHDCAFFWGLIGGIFHVVAGVVLPQNRPVVDAMFRTGMLPLSFIKEHHSLWYEELKKELGLKE